MRMTLFGRPLGCTALLVVMATARVMAASQAKSSAPPSGGVKPADPYAALTYRFVGPPGNRVSAVVGVPGDPNTYYAGGASGGVWKS